jgi:hypothetical protein
LRGLTHIFGCSTEKKKVFGKGKIKGVCVSKLVGVQEVVREYLSQTIMLPDLPVHSNLQEEERLGGSKPAREPHVPLYHQLLIGSEVCVASIVWGRWCV